MNRRTGAKPKKIGFWKHKGRKKEIKALIDCEWKTDHVSDYKAVLKYINASNRINYYKGWATCALCGKKLGSSDAIAPDERWRYPDQYDHYLVAHDVKPSDEFIKDALKWMERRKVKKLLKDDGFIEYALKWKSGKKLLHYNVTCARNDSVDIKCGGPATIGYDFFVSKEKDQAEMIKFIKKCLKEYRRPLIHISVGNKELDSEEYATWTKKKIRKCIKEVNVR